MIRGDAPRATSIVYQFACSVIDHVPIKRGMCALDFVVRDVTAPTRATTAQAYTHSNSTPPPTSPHTQ